MSASTSTMVYTWSQRKHVVSPQLVGETVERIADREGCCTPARLVDEARDTIHPLHSLFTWPDGEAATKWRTHEARNVINSLRVTVIAEDQETTMPAFLSVGHTRETQDAGEGYRPVSVVFATEDFATEVLDDVVSRIQALRQRYRHLSELSSVWKAIDELDVGTHERTTR